MHPNIPGALTNSALYLLCVFVAGIVTAHPFAWRFALITMGLAFFANIIQMAGKRGAHYLIIASWATGALAGLALLV